MTTPHERSVGARMERKAIRAYLRRQIKGEVSNEWFEALDSVLSWVLSRQQRYDRKPGGLGKR